MKIVLLVEGGRPVPAALETHCTEAGFALTKINPRQADWQQKLPEAFGIMLLLPSWARGSYLSSVALWYQYLLSDYPEKRLLVASYQTKAHQNHIDLLRLSEYSHDWWQDSLKVKTMEDLPFYGGLDLSGKLKRFFAGHGQDSVVAVLSRIRLVVQMACREMEKMQTPYIEIYNDLVAPAQLGEKWKEWRNRWINYYPLFEYTPIADQLEHVAALTERVEPWMLAGGAEEKALANGSVLRTLNEVRTQLQQIEKQYVVQKLSHTYR